MGPIGKDAKKLELQRRKIDQIKAFLTRGEKKIGPSGQEQKSNITDPESAKMASSRGVLQGYNGLAVVDERAQIVVHAEAHGSGYEGHLLAPLIEATRETFRTLEPGRDVFQKAKVTADSGFHSRAVVAEVEGTGADVYIADRNYRRRDPAFANASRYKERERKERTRERAKKAKESAASAKLKPFSLRDFFYDERKELCICPAGHKLYHSGKHLLFNGYRAEERRTAEPCRGAFQSADHGMSRLHVESSMSPSSGAHAAMYGVLHQRLRRAEKRVEEAWRRGADAVQVRHGGGAGDLQSVRQRRICYC